MVVWDRAQSNNMFSAPKSQFSVLVTEFFQEIGQSVSLRQQVRGPL
jgi:hypothetical protein